MSTDYDKVLTITKNGRLAAVVVNDTVAHTPTFYKVEKMGMDEVKDLLNNENDKNLPK